MKDPNPISQFYGIALLLLSDLLCVLDIDFDIYSSRKV